MQLPSLVPDAFLPLCMHSGQQQRESPKNLLRSVLGDSCDIAFPKLREFQKQQTFETGSGAPKNGVFGGKRHRYLRFSPT
ncbi:MAG TPA: hypothetical protein DDW78_09225 [Treponema sp.]|nr:hypothetical protein [Treponema sp.]